MKTRSMSRRMKTLLLAASLPVLCWATAANAQSVTTGSAKATKSAVQGLGEVIVTASKRARNIQREAISITAVTASALASRGVTDPGQLAGLAPSVQFQPTFLLLTYIRGVGNYSSQPGVDQSIAYNVDGIYLDRPYAMPNIMFDLQRVELLRGPQGTLEGRNSTGGAVDLVTNEPTDKFGGSFAMSYGNYNAVTTEAMLNVPITDGVDLRVSAANARHNGYFSNGMGDQNAYGARARLLIHTDPKLKILITGEYTGRDERGPSDSICPPGSTGNCVGIPWRPFSGEVNQGMNNTDSIDMPQVLKDSTYAIYADVNYDLGFANLTWVPSYRFLTYRSDQAYSSAFGYAPAARDSMHSEELRLASKSGSPITWVVGAYYGRQQSTEQDYFLAANVPSVTVNESGFEPVSNVYFENNFNRYVYESKSVYGQLTVPLITGLRGTVGGRFTADDKSVVGSSAIVVAGPTVLSTPVSAAQSNNKGTFKVGLEYDITPHAMAYANVSTGYKAGGVNGVPAGSGLPASFGPETILAYQAGLKSRFLDDRLQVNSEGFFYDYQGYQTSLFGVTQQGILIGLNTNSQKAQMYGMEIEASALITPVDRLDVNGSLLQAKYIKFVIPSNGTNLSGEPMQNAPKQSLGINYTHSFVFDSFARVDAHVEARYEGPQWVDYRLSPGSFVPGFWRESADVTYHSSDEKWSIQAYVHNISNNGSPDTAVAGLGAYELAVPLPPRTFGVRVSTTF